MLYGHEDPTFWYLYAKIQPNAESNSYYFPICVKTNMPTSLGIHAIYLMGIYDICISMYVQHMKALTSTMQHGALYTYLTCITEKI